ncbi:hypothetical protein FVE85_7548 [Porphyridium purpureum]|uniref:Uncharacterized protein n=1 Tax=Porphyridium purpureum TaxID=35688 RepID=A0A5J4ZB30_PORPP|nr:hypothetical protein FVE85_7548 [Porphyridium purpureum]|eukprot:POR9208..scf295_1
MENTFESDNCGEQSRVNLEVDDDRFPAVELFRGPGARTPSGQLDAENVAPLNTNDTYPAVMSDTEDEKFMPLTMLNDDVLFDSPRGTNLSMSHSASPSASKLSISSRSSSNSDDSDFMQEAARLAVLEQEELEVCARNASLTSGSHVGAGSSAKFHAGENESVCAEDGENELSIRSYPRSLEKSVSSCAATEADSSRHVRSSTTGNLDLGHATNRQAETGHTVQTPVSIKHTEYVETSSRGNSSRHTIYETARKEADGDGESPSACSVTDMYTPRRHLGFGKAKNGRAYSQDSLNCSGRCRESSSVKSQQVEPRLLMLGKESRSKTKFLERLLAQLLLMTTMVKVASREDTENHGACGNDDPHELSTEDHIQRLADQILCALKEGPTLAPTSHSAPTLCVTEEQRETDARIKELETARLAWVTEKSSLQAEIEALRAAVSAAKQEQQSTITVAEDDDEDMSCTASVSSVLESGLVMDALQATTRNRLSVPVGFSAHAETDESVAERLVRCGTSAGNDIVALLQKHGDAIFAARDGMKEDMSDNGSVASALEDEEVQDALRSIAQARRARLSDLQGLARADERSPEEFAHASAIARREIQGLVTAHGDTLTSATNFISNYHDQTGALRVLLQEAEARKSEVERLVIELQEKAVAEADQREEFQERQQAKVRDLESKMVQAKETAEREVSEVKASAERELAHLREEFEREVTRASEEVKQLRLELAIASDFLQKEKERNKTLELEFAQAKEDMEREADKTIHAANEKCDLVTHELEHLQDQHALLRTEVQLEKEQLRAARDKVVQYKGKMDRLHARHKDSVESMKQVIRDLQELNERECTEIEVLKESRRALMAREKAALAKANADRTLLADWLDSQAKARRAELSAGTLDSCGEDMFKSFAESLEQAANALRSAAV